MNSIYEFSCILQDMPVRDDPLGRFHPALGATRFQHVATQNLNSRGRLSALEHSLAYETAQRGGKHRDPTRTAGPGQPL